MIPKITHVTSHTEGIYPTKGLFVNKMLAFIVNAEIKTLELLSGQAKATSGENTKEYFANILRFYRTTLDLDLSYEEGTSDLRGVLSDIEKISKKTDHNFGNDITVTLDELTKMTHPWHLINLKKTSTEYAPSSTSCSIKDYLVDPTLDENVIVESKFRGTKRNLNAKYRGRNGKRKTFVTKKAFDEFNEGMIVDYLKKNYCHNILNYDIIKNSASFLVNVKISESDKDRTYLAYEGKI